MIISDEFSIKFLVLEEGESLDNNKFYIDDGDFEIEYSLEETLIEGKYKIIDTKQIEKRSLVGTELGKQVRFIRDYKDSGIIDSYDGYFQNLTDIETGNKFWFNCGYLAVTREWIGAFYDWLGGSKVLELFSGLGGLSKELDRLGTDIVSVDNGSYRFFSKQEPFYDKIVNKDALEAIEDYAINREVLICGFPPNDGQMLGVLQKMREVNPSMVMVYIAPYNSDYTGDNFVQEASVLEDSGFDYVASLYKDWINYPAFAAEFKLIK